MIFTSHKINKVNLICFCLAIAWVVAFTEVRPAAASAGERGPEPAGQWSLTLFNGIHTDRTIGRATFNIPGSFNDHYFHGLALSRGMGELRQHFSWEVEGTAAWHRDRRSGVRQDYQEFTAAALVRYHNLPWNHLLPTTVAAGNGLSYATRSPQIEADLNAGRSRHLLNYLALELAVAPPRFAGVELVYRIHHRSGVFGLFGGVRGASDFYLLGLRYRF